ncbi:MAG: lipoate--protein ligase family protein [Candidatus Omnitrophica bacterium]|nr:lipoate--protein ligase family protein [Candidatus Omnitrophota bacterium]
MWRLILDSARSGQENMALDEALWLSYKEEPAGPVLRFYQWSSSTLTLGRLQKLEDVNEEACRQYGVSALRRPTGGGEVLHERDLTFSLVLPVEGNALPKGILASYRFLHQALAAGLRNFGLETRIFEPETARRAKGGPEPCFTSWSRHDLVAEFGKVLGGAQRRGGGVLLHQGTLQLWPARIPVQELLSRKIDDAAPRVQRGPDLSEEEFKALPRVLAGSVADAFKVRMSLGEFRAVELQRAESLLRGKYTQREWCLCEGSEGVLK